MSSAHQKKSGTIFGFIRLITVAIFLALLFRSFILQPFYIPSESMVPTFEVGDRLFVTKYSYGYSKFSFPFGLIDFEGRYLYTEPQRGDVVVFRHPRSNEDWIKRLVGLPGDVVQVKRGRLYINGNQIDRVEVPSTLENITAYIETFDNGQQHIIHEKSDIDLFDNTQKIKIPDDQFFVMGDNRDNSSDSRTGFFVPKNNLIGQARWIFFSFDSYKGSFYEFWKWPWIIRFDRFFKNVN